MANSVDPPNDNDTGGSPGDTGYVPPTGSNTKIAVVTTNTNLTITEAQIVAAGGPWASFTIRVTPVNDYGVGAYAEATYPDAVTFDSATATFDETHITWDRN